jgi:curved DNA-binding protein CbpA
MSSDFIDLYKILKVSITASQDEIRSAYRILVKQQHPDVNNNCGKSFILTKNAYDILSKKDDRREYDILYIEEGISKVKIVCPQCNNSGFAGSSDFQNFKCKICNSTKE